MENIQVAPKFIWLAMGLICFFVPSESQGADPWYIEYCNNIPGGNADVKNCLWKHRNEELSSLGFRACSDTHCIYKLEFAYEIARQNDWATYVYRGNGYEYYYLDNVTVPLKLHLDGSYHSSRLIDSNGDWTIMAQCGGSSCSGYFEYDHGPLFGAEIRGWYGGSDLRNSFFVLKLPR